MPRRGNIKWTDSQVKRLRNEVRAYNTALTKAAKRDPAIVQFLPERLNVKELRQQISTAKDLNKFVKQVKKQRAKPLNLTTTEGGVTTTSWELERVEEVYAKAERARAKRRKLSKIPQKEGRIGTEWEAAYRPRTRTPQTVKQEGWEKFVKQIEREISSEYWGARDEQFKENYIESLWVAFGPNSDTLKLVEQIEKLSAATLIKGTLDDSRLKINEHYPLKGDTWDPGTERSAMMKQLSELWAPYAEEG